jgi:hypothetical protein
MLKATRCIIKKKTSVKVEKTTKKDINRKKKISSCKGACRYMEGIEKLVRHASKYKKKRLGKQCTVTHLNTLISYLYKKNVSRFSCFC